MREIDSEDRSHLECSTFASLLALKLNIDQDCFDHIPWTGLNAVNSMMVVTMTKEIEDGLVDQSLQGT